MIGVIYMSTNDTYGIGDAFKGIANIIIEESHLDSGDYETYERKIRKHISNDDPDRVKDYLCHYYDIHRVSSDARMGRFVHEVVSGFMRNHGWSLRVNGDLFACVSPKNEWYTAGKSFK